MIKLLLIFSLVLVLSCSESGISDYSLPEECGGKCWQAGDTNSFQDALVNSAASFSNCICLSEGIFEGKIRIGKPLKIIGRKDGGTFLKNLVISNTYDVLLKDFSFKGVSVEESALYISGSSVTLENLSVQDVSAASLAGGRGIVVSGGESDVKIRNSIIEKTDGTCLLVNGVHKVSLENVSVSKCGFAGVWVQNQSGKRGNIVIENSTFKENSAVAVEILGNSSLKVTGSTFENIKKREFMLESVGDGIVVKNPHISEKDSVVIESSVISDFARAGIIFDGENGTLPAGAVLKDISLFSDKGSFGLIVQNALEDDSLRRGIIRNDFSVSDSMQSDELFIIDTFFDLQ